MVELYLVILGIVFVAADKSVGKLQLYDLPNFKNLIFDADVTEQCINIPQINDRASSVHTNGACVYFYEHWHCTGRRIRVEHGSPSHENLTDLNFDNVASSLRACCPPIPGRHDCCSMCPVPYGNKTSPFFLQTAILRIYDKYDYKDLIYEGVPTEECVNLSYANNRTSSVDTLGTCVVLYDGNDCVGPHIVVRPGCPSAKNLANLHFDNTISSIRACCNQRDWASSDSCSFPFTGRNRPDDQTNIIKGLGPNAPMTERYD